MAEYSADGELIIGATEEAPPEEEATPETSPEQLAQPKEYTVEELEAVFDRASARQQAQFDRRIARVEETVSSIPQILQETRQGRIIMQAILEGNSTEEQIEQANALIAKDVADQELKGLREFREKVTRQPTAEEQVGARESFFNSYLRPGMMRIAREEGLSYEEVLSEIMPNMPKSLTATQDDPQGIYGYLDAWRQAVRGKSDATSSGVKVRTDTTRPTGGSPSTDMADYTKRLKAGDKLPSPEEIDRMTAKFSS